MAGPGSGIHLCGRLRIAIGGEQREGQLRGRQGRLVLAYLVLHRGRPVRRDELFEALAGPDGAPPGQSVLAPVLSRVRGAIAPAVIEGRESLELSLPGPVWIDVDVAEQAVADARDGADPAQAMARAREAADLTAAGLLPDLDAPWLDEPRQAVQELHVDALELVAVTGRTVDPRAAEAAARAAVALAPFRESARVALIGALQARGNLAEALRAYDDVRILLREELGTVPGPALVALHRELLAASEEPVAAPAPAVRPAGRAPEELVERGGELAEIDDALGRLAQGQGGVVLLEGPPGIGKTALLRELAGRATGARVLQARGGLLEREYGFGVVRQLFEPVAADDALVGGGAHAARTALSDDGTGEGTFPVLNGLFQLTANVASSGPVVLSIDDLQWTDPASLRFVAYLVRRVAALPVLVAATLRTGEELADAVLISEIVQDPIAVTLRPRLLTVAATTDLVRGRLGQEADAGFADACQEVTAGNPLLVRQLLAALAAERIAPESARAAEVRAIGSRAISRTVLPRLARMGDAAIAVARAVAILGDDPGLAELAALAAMEEEDVVDTVEALARTDILRAAEPLGFVHPLVRDAVYLEMSAARRGLEHERAAQLLTGRGASPERVAAQLLLAPPKGDPEVVTQLRAAAHIAMRRGAPDAALTLLERAQAEPAPPEQRGALALELGGSAAYVRGPAGVEPLRRAYDELTDPVDRGRAAIRLSHLLLFVRSPQEGVAVALQAADELSGDLDDLRQGLMTVCLIGAAFGAVDVADLPERARQAPSGDGPGARALLAMTAFRTALACGPAAEASAQAHAALAGDGLETFEVTAPVALATAALTLGEPGDGLRAIERYTVHARTQGEILGSIGADLWGGFAQIWAGDLPAAIVSLERAQEGERLWGTKLDAVMGYSAAFLALAWLERGDADAAERELHRVDAGEGVSDGARFWLASRAELLLARGRPEEAVAITERLEGMRPAETHPVWAPWRSLRAWGLAALGDGPAALVLAEEELALARRTGAAWVVARGLRIRGELQGAGGVDDVRAAAAMLDGSSAGLEVAKTRAALARLESAAWT